MNCEQGTTQKSETITNEKCTNKALNVLYRS